MWRAEREIAQKAKSKLYSSGQHHEDLNVWMKGVSEHQHLPL